MSAPTSPYFSVVIPTCHRNEDLAKCLHCLAPGIQTFEALDYEVIVSDDGSSSTAENLIHERYPWAKWTQGPRRGPAANRNHGAAIAAGEWLVFTDDDCLPSRGWLAAFEAATPGASVLEGVTRADRERLSHAEEAPINLTGGYLWSCNFAIRRASFALLDGFDENYPTAAMEDCDLHERLHRRGIPPRFVPEAEVVHPWRPARGPKQWAEHYQSYCYYRRKLFEESRLQMSLHYGRFGFAALKAFMVSLASSQKLRNRGWNLVASSWLLGRACRTLLLGCRSGSN
jgi:GT2 family glycosyltransferase